MTSTPERFQVHESGAYFHGTKADLSVGDLLVPGRPSNYEEGRIMNHIYVTKTLDGAVWAAEMAKGDGPGRIYIVEPEGDLEDDPNVTDKKFPGESDPLLPQPPTREDRRRVHGLGGAFARSAPSVPRRAGRPRAPGAGRHLRLLSRPRHPIPKCPPCNDNVDVSDKTTCAVVGGGPAGLFLGLLLARAGVEVTVLEKHGDFLRDFRGDTVHPVTMRLLDELGLFERFDQLPHSIVERGQFDVDGRLVTLRRLPASAVDAPSVCGDGAAMGSARPDRRRR